jgi:sialic acid synthase SpsE/sugar phosphate isomerase/epimerase
MLIEKKIKSYLVFSGQPIASALRQINENQSRIIFVVEENGVLIGSLSDGDIRRWMVQFSHPDLNSPVDNAMNINFVSCNINFSSKNLYSFFNHKREIIPLIDDSGRFVAIARRSHFGFQLGDFLITDNSKTFVIAEIGNNHNGDFGLAKHLVDLAIEAKADCVKFQMRDLSSLYSNNGKNAEASYDLGSQYTLDLLNKFQLSNDALCNVFDYCKAKGIMPLCTPWDIESSRVLLDYGMHGFKVASADLTNNQLLEFLSNSGRPLICSTGMSTESEIKGAVALLNQLGIPFALLHCNSTYPTPYKDVNLNYLTRLREISGCVVGYSGHERGFSIPLAAVALGARIIEKHFTIDKEMEGNDHKVSLLPSEFSEMVKQIRIIEESLGRNDERYLSQGELINRENLAKSLVINCDLPKGDVIRREMIEVRSPGQGLQPNRLGELVGKVAFKNFKKGDFFYESDLTPLPAKKNRYSFTRPYGIPVRYHDFKSLTCNLDIDFVEFHLSYHDLDIDPSEFICNTQSIGFAVHSPELFSGDHILNLASNDFSYQSQSIGELKRVLKICNSLKQLFPKTEKPILVLNAGGWSTIDFIPKDCRKENYERVLTALNKIDLTSVQLAIQTMPPFPWHFGGQSFHNLFVDPDEIHNFCNETGHKICLDVSHSMMACNFYKWSFSEFLTKVLPHTIHMHIVDAKGIDGEGVQIGEGDVDFSLLKSKMNQYAKKVQFIPEVWQGHKNNGEGFWSALSFLENLKI